jgi:hypothetical protein
MNRKTSRTNNTNPFSQQEEETILQLKQGLDQLDQAYPIATPSSEWFEQNLLEQIKRHNSDFRREFKLFLVIAVTILLVTITSYRVLPVLFFVVQGLALLSLIPMIIKRTSRKED